ncbi:rhomboid family intramembrane serine protease [Sporosarcina saromensis]|uniref:Rhomboid family intramembrane serine protease n=2 Tax=Sporosarcina saromensis TaxID=359365 RepID=A0ABU4G809_9BACL|nr:rhomboid family intramembrane serine protease [Sporosarcina saromensis]
MFDMQGIKDAINNLDLETVKEIFRKAPATTLLTVLLVASFLASYIYGDGPTDYKTARLFGAISPQDATTDDLYRLISYTFLQIGGPIHLLMNLSMIVVAGPFLERVYGPFKYTFLFIVTGMVGGLFVLMFSGTDVFVGGASGSGYGLIGLYVGLLLKRHPHIDEDLKSWIWNLLWINILFTAFVPGISIAGHLGGLAGGLLLSIFVRYQSDKYYYNGNWLTSLVKSVLGFTAALSLIYIPKLIWPSKVIPYIQEVRMKFGESVALDSFTGQIVEDSLGKEFLLENLAGKAGPLYYYGRLLIDIVKTSFIEITVCIVILILMYNLLKHMRKGWRIRQVVKTHYLYHVAKENRQEHIIYRIGNSTVNTYTNQYPNVNYRKAEKKVQSEIKLMFGNPLMKVLDLLIGTGKLSLLLLMSGCIMIFISLINDNKKLNMAAFEENLFIDAVAYFDSGNYEAALNILKMISSESNISNEVQQMIPVYQQAYDMFQNEEDSDYYSEWEYEDDIEIIEYESMGSWAVDVVNGRLNEIPEFTIGQIFSENLFDDLIWENHDQFVSVGGYYAGEIRPGHPSLVTLHLYPTGQGYYTIGQVYLNGDLVDDVRGMYGILDIITTPLR